MGYQISRFRSVFITMGIFELLIVAGCAPNLALKKDQENIDLSKYSVAFISVTIKNKIAPDCWLRIAGIRRTSQMYSLYNWMVNFRMAEGQFISFRVEAGNNKMASLWVGCSIYTLPAVGIVPLNLDINIEQNSICYLGHLDIRIRKISNNDEQSADYGVTWAGNLAAGLRSGTYDVVVEDRFDEDIGTFVAEYPVLQRVKINKCILPQWSRQEADKIRIPIEPHEFRSN